MQVSFLHKKLAKQKENVISLCVKSVFFAIGLKKHHIKVCLMTEKKESLRDIMSKAASMTQAVQHSQHAVKNLSIKRSDSKNMVSITCNGLHHPIAVSLSDEAMLGTKTNLEKQLFEALTNLTQAVEQQAQTLMMAQFKDNPLFNADDDTP